MGIFIAFVRKDHSVIVSYLLAKKKENEKNMNICIRCIDRYLILFKYVDTWIAFFRINIMIDCVMYDVGKQRWNFV